MAVGADAPFIIPPGCVVTIDSAPLIYYLEDHPLYAQQFAPIFEAVADGQVHAVISLITLAEVLSGPLKSGNEVIAAR